MLSTKLKEAAGNSADATLYVDDVFSTYLYTGNGSTQTITNGIDLAGKGGLVWCKKRDSLIVNGPHYLTDTNRGAGNYLSTNSTAASSFDSQINAFNSNGFSIGSDGANVNLNGSTYASWTFRKAAKFFDVVTYTGTGSARTIAHSLGVAPGMIIVKRTDASANWQVYHRSLTSAAYSIQLNLTNAQASAPTVWNSTAPTSSVFSVGTDATVNASGGTYVAYLYAHDTSSTGIIQCGSFTTDGSGNATVNLGWEPQYILAKRSNSSTNGNWRVIDNMRGMPVGSAGNYLVPNTVDVDSTASFLYPTATGFYSNSSSIVEPSAPYIYMAIRMPNKPPTTGTQVYQPDRPSSSGTFTIDAGFPIDFSIAKGPNAGDTEYVGQRLTGSYALDTTNANGEYNLGWGFASNTSATIAGTGNYSAWISWNFKRAPGFMDVVCYTGDGVSNRNINHNLGVTPQLVICKPRSAAGDWKVFETPAGGSVVLLNSTAAFTVGTLTGGYLSATSSTLVTASPYSSSISAVNASGTTYVAYLFATLAGISKVGSYTGNGTSQNIECGFAAGARFFLVKATSTTGSWWVWDSARGITAGNDPALQLNSTAAEITTADAVDPYSPGITVNQEATCSINANGVSYIFLAVA